MSNGVVSPPWGHLERNPSSWFTFILEFILISRLERCCLDKSFVILIQNEVVEKTEHSSIFWVMKMIIEWWETDVYCLQLLVKFRQIISLDSLGSEFHLKAPPAPTLPCVACASAYANYADYANYARFLLVSRGFSWFPQSQWYFYRISTVSDRCVDTLQVWATHAAAQTDRRVRFPRKPQVTKESRWQMWRAIWRNFVYALCAMLVWKEADYMFCICSYREHKAFQLQHPQIHSLSEVSPT